jgi:hypothetical protein
MAYCDHVGTFWCMQNKGKKIQITLKTLIHFWKIMYVSPKEIYNVFYRLEKTNIDYETKLESQHIKKINNKIQNQQRIREYPRKIIKLTQTTTFGSDF